MTRVMTTHCALVALCIIGGALAAITKLGPCPKVDTMTKFDTVKHLGTWHHIETYHERPHIDDKCETEDFILNDTGTLYGINARISRWTGILTAVQSRYRAPDPTKPGEFKVKHSFAPKEANISFLATDHTSYSITYNCVQHGAMNTRRAWVWTRDPNPPQSVLDKIIEITNKNQLNRSNFWKIQQDHCDLEPDKEITK